MASAWSLAWHGMWSIEGGKEKEGGMGRDRGRDAQNPSITVLLRINCIALRKA